MPPTRRSTSFSSIVQQPFDGRAKSFVHANGLTEWRTLDLDGRVSGYGVSDSGVARLDKALAYGDGVNLTEVGDDLDPGKDESYWYTPTNRLQNSAGPFGEIDIYTDGVGNRTFADRTPPGGTTATDAYTP